MKTKDFLRLPFGQHKVSDGIYTYSLEKRQKEWGDMQPYYSLREWGTITGGSVSLYEDKQNYFHDSDKYKTVTLTFTAFIGGLVVSGEDVFYCINKLRVLPKSSYKKWDEQMAQISLLEPLSENK